MTPAFICSFFREQCYLTEAKTVKHDFSEVRSLKRLNVVLSFPDHSSFRISVNFALDTA